MKPESREDPLIAVIARAIARWLPPVDPASVSEEDFQNLKARNRGLDTIAQILCVAGIIGGGFLPLAVRGRPLQFKTPDLGVLFGLGVALPTFFILLIGVIRGKPRLLEFLTFYSIKYGIDARQLFLFIYIPVILLGMVCVWLSYFSGNS